MLTGKTCVTYPYVTPVFAGCVALVAATQAADASALGFNITPGPGLVAMQSGTFTQRSMAAKVIGGFTAAADIWRGVLHDPVTLNLTVEYSTLPPNFAAGTTPEFVEFNYADALYPAMVADRLGVADEIAVAHLPAPLPTGVPFVTNDTTVVPAPRVLDDDGTMNNTSILVTRAHAKALGLITPHDTGSDGLITFNEQIPFDFTPDDGILTRQFDFVMLGVHELGHALGFFSGIEIVDAVGGDGTDPEGPFVDERLDLNPGSIFTPIDLFRYTNDSLSWPNQPAGGLNDGAFGQPSPNDRPFFSLDGGVTQLATFSTGQFNGEGLQVSHWQDNLGLGIMDPSLARGEPLILTPLDVLALDVIGWDTQPVPEPGAALVFAAGGLWLLVKRGRR